MLDRNALQKKRLTPMIMVMGVFLLLFLNTVPVTHAQEAQNAQNPNTAGQEAPAKKSKEKSAEGETDELNVNEYESAIPKYPVLKGDHSSRDHYGIIDAKKYMDALTPRITGRKFDPEIKVRRGTPSLEDLSRMDNPDSNYLLGLKYEKGDDNFTKDVEQSCHWYERAVQGGHVKAYAKLAACYISGQGRPYNPARAKTLYELGILNKDITAFCGLGKLLYYNSNELTDIQRALELCRSGAAKGDHQAAFDLYEIYRDGLKISRSDYSAKSWLKSAVKKRNKDALIELSRLYQSGYLFKKNIAKSHEILRYLALEGDINSQFELANMYYDNMITENGVNTEILERAMFWYYTVQSRSKDPNLEKQSRERFRKMARSVSSDFIEMVEARYLNWAYKDTYAAKDEPKDDDIVEIDRVIPVFDKIRKEKEEAARTPVEE